MQILGVAMISVWNDGSISRPGETLPFIWKGENTNDIQISYTVPNLSLIHI